jgi:dTDP-4-dehydrorhamnose 3,5-epimerase
MENSQNIDGVFISPLKIFTDQRGSVLHYLRSDITSFAGFKEAYFAETNQSVIKAWKKHENLTQHFAVPVGKLKLVIYDERENSKTKGTIQTIILGRPENYNLVCIPPMVWYGFQAIFEDCPTLIVNSIDHYHSDAITDTLPINNHKIPYKWT